MRRPSLLRLLGILAPQGDLTVLELSNVGVPDSYLLEPNQVFGLRTLPAATRTVHSNYAVPAST